MEPTTRSLLSFFFWFHRPESVALFLFGFDIFFLCVCRFDSESRRDGEPTRPTIDVLGSRHKSAINKHTSAAEVCESCAQTHTHTHTHTHTELGPSYYQIPRRCCAAILGRPAHSSSSSWGYASLFSLSLSLSVSVSKRPFLSCIIDYVARLGVVFWCCCCCCCSLRVERAPRFRFH